MTQRIHDGLLGLILGLLLASGMCIWRAMQTSMPSILATSAKELSNAKKQKLDCVPLVIYQDTVKRDLGLPADVSRDVSQAVISATHIPADYRQRTLTSLWDSTTGRVDQYVNIDPLPWAANNYRYEVGIGYGFTQHGPVTRLDGSVDLLQVKAAHIGLAGALDSSGGFYGGGRLWFSW